MFLLDLHTGFSGDREGGLISPSLFKNFPQFVVIYTVKGICVVHKAYAFLEFPCFFYDPTNVGNLISDSSAFSKSGLFLWRFLVHVLLQL